MRHAAEIGPGIEASGPKVAGFGNVAGEPSGFAVFEQPGPVGSAFGAIAENLQGLGGAILEVERRAEVHLRGEAYVPGRALRTGHRLPEGVFGFGVKAVGHAHAAPGQPERGGRARIGYGLGKQDAVAQAFPLHRLGVAVTRMQDFGGRGTHRHAGLGDGFADVLMHGIAETQPAAVREQADLVPGGFPAAGVGRTHPEGVGIGGIQAREMRAQPVPGGSGQFVVGVEP